MATIVTRAGKGSPLTNAELDANFVNLNVELGTKADASSLAGYQPLDGDLTAIAGLSGQVGLLRKNADNTWAIDTAAYLTGITAAQVTAALGFTPYNATNPAGYITTAGARSAISASGSLSYNSTTGVISFTDAVNSVAGKTGAVTLTNTDVGLGNVENKSSATIRSEITSGNVTTALGFTPYNATNPAGYISGINSSMVTTALGYTPANRAGDTFTGAVTFSGGINPNAVFKAEGGAEGGQFLLEKGSTGTTLSGNLVVDLVGDVLRFFDGSGTNRGAFLNIMSQGTGAGSRILTDTTLTSGNVTTALGYTPANRAGDTFTGNIVLSNGADRRVRIGSSTNYFYDLQTTGDNFQIIEAGTTPRLTISYPSGAVIAATDFRAPIFYDSNNTGYYIDGAGTSFLNTLSTREDIGSGTAAAFIWTGSELFYYWTRIANVSGGDASATILITSKGDTNYVNFASALLTISAWNGSTASVKLETLNGCDTTMNVRIDNNNDVWLQVHSPWSSNLSWKVINKVGSPTVYYASPTQQTATPANSVNITYGQTVRGNQGAMSSAAVDNVANTIVGGLEARREVRAPIFYDSNNTAFYIDPAGNSILSTLRASNIQFPSGTVAINLDNTSYQIFRSPDGGIRMYLGGADAANYYDNETHWFRNRATSNVAYINANGVYAPVFYDFSDSGYYIDPNSTGTSFRGRGQVYLGPNANSRFLAIGGDPGSTDESRVATSNGNLHIDSRAGHQLYLNWYSAQPVWSEGGAYFPIYYDRQDSSFYCDPNGISVLNTVNTWGEIGPRRNDTQSLLRSYNTSAGQPLQFYLDHNFGNVNIGNSRGAVFAGGSYWEIANSVRSPIFYDSNDTAYFVDPNSSGTSAVFAGDIHINDTTWGADKVLRFREGATDVYGAYIKYGGNDNLELGTRNNSTTDIRAIYISRGANWAGSDGSFRAPIFFDSNDTGFYVDPNSVSRLNVVRSTTITGMHVAGGTGIDMATNDNYVSMRVIRNEQTSGTFSDGMYIGYANGNGGVTRIYGGGSAGDPFVKHATFSQEAGSFRAPIFYDSQNTGYYCDPTSDSIFYRFQNINQRVSYDRAWDNFPSITVYNTTDQGPQGDFRIHGAPGSNGGDFNVRLLVDGNVHSLSDLVAGGSCFAQVYYDSNDTFFYLNPNGYSQVNGFGSVNASSGVGFNIMGNPSNGAMMAFHRSNAFAINMGLDTDNVFRMGGWSAAANRLQMDMSGNLTMAGNVAAYSDARLKKDVETIDGALDLVSKMRGVRYTRIDTEKRNVGVIAQEMLEVLPEVVQQGVGDDDTLSVAYGNLVGVLIEAIKELKTEVETLKKEYH